MRPGHPEDPERPLVGWDVPGKRYPHKGDPTKGKFKNFSNF